MSATRTGSDARGAAARSWARLADGRRMAVAVATLLAVLVVAGLLTAAVAVLILAVLVVLIVLMPPGRVDERPGAPVATVAPAAIPSALQAFAEALPDPCFIIDRRGKVLALNQRAAHDFPLRPGDALTIRLRAPDLVAAFERVARGGPPERVEFVERGTAERWFAAWFAHLDSSRR